MSRTLRILLSSHAFYPSIGGIETASLIFAKSMTERGHRVTVVTSTPGQGDDEKFSFVIKRKPDATSLIALTRDAHVVWQNNISLRTFWPLFFIQRPVVIVHHTWLGRDAGLGPVLTLLKRLACLRGVNVFVSQALKAAAKLPGRVIPNPYDDTTFHLMPEVKRDRDVAFVGRLVTDKGADILIEALGALVTNGMRLSATIIGSGPESEALKAQARAAGLRESISFPGTLWGVQLTRELNRHRMLVVPSRWKEPFGIVVLEGLACGCVVIGTLAGGLPEAIGLCGITIPNDNAAALTSVLNSLVTHPERLASYQSHIPSHLVDFLPPKIIDQYESILLEAVRR